MVAFPFVFGDVSQQLIHRVVEVAIVFTLMPLESVGQTVPYSV